MTLFKKTDESEETNGRRLAGRQMESGDTADQDTNSADNND